ncbi:MAG TPA: sensor histidine kinase [Candidatus Solibacter sp.]|nr:sensor histidine kinase [Candidatus Solibacter sp.]
MRHFRKAAVVLLVDTAGAAIPAVLMYVFRLSSGTRDLWEHFKFGLVYAHSIGTLCFLVVGRVAVRISGLRRMYQIPAFALTFVSLAVAGAFPAGLILVALHWVGPDEFWPQYLGSLRIAIAMTLAVGATISSFEMLTHRLHATTLELRTRQLEEERSRKLATEARLSSLESRIHPHFLFNTLNSISALIREDPVLAERTVERLAALLRYSLDSSARGLVPLRQELRVVQDYLEIEKTRFGDRLRCMVDVPDGIGDLEVPPMTLQTLVENCIKHAVSSNRFGGEIRVTAQLRAEHLLLEVSDDGPGFDKDALKPGHGLDTLQDRLAVLFDGAGRLELSQRDGRMTVSVAVPQKSKTRTGKVLV